MVTRRIASLLLLFTSAASIFSLPTFGFQLYGILRLDGPGARLQGFIGYSFILAAALGLARVSGISRSECGLQLPTSHVNWLRLFLVQVGLRYLSIFIYGFMDVPPVKEFAPTLAAYWLIAYFSVVEEVFFRGWFQAALRRRLEISGHGNWTAFLNGLFFGLMHTLLVLYGTPASGVYAAVLNTAIYGWVYAKYREQSGSILPGTAAHVGINLWSTFVVSLSV